MANPLAYSYIISKHLDPVFALAIGLSAAAVRIRREEREKGRGVEQSWAVLKRRVAAPHRWRWMTGETAVQEAR
ncbi:MAG: hypothetical protein M1829_004458 [Trizodia sp. TS-e1964]|nr:MAG: hypothetical protein M1829_004458 [Trizodia sp. TS-e1964]